ncbi:hypothetical protein OH77DRAFT_1260768 [Trametes cingulata]|nr:hypothetical protein OH77DRAFT_1260768 [Trametes cingulata]
MAHSTLSGLWEDGSVVSVILSFCSSIRVGMSPNDSVPFSCLTSRRSLWLRQLDRDSLYTAVSLTCYILV